MVVVVLILTPKTGHARVFIVVTVFRVAPALVATHGDVQFVAIAVDVVHPNPHRRRAFPERLRPLVGPVLSAVAEREQPGVTIRSHTAH